MAAIDVRLIAELKRLEDIINEHERPSVFARWASGCQMLSARPEGKMQLPKGMLDIFVDEVGISRTEVGYRLKFATKYHSEDEVSTVVETFKTWTRIRIDALRDKPCEPAADTTEDDETADDTIEIDEDDGQVYTEGLQRMRSFLDNMEYRRLTPADREELLATKASLERAIAGMDILRDIASSRDLKVA